MMKHTFYFSTLLTAMLLLTACPPQPPKNNQQAPQEEEAPKEKPVINVYVDNCVSMDGFVKSNSNEFRHTIFGYLVNIKGASVTDSFNLYYRNQRQNVTFVNFEQKLTSQAFAQSGRSGSTDIALMLEQVLNNTQENDISIMITDGIFSPTCSEIAGTSVEGHLLSQYNRIKNAVDNFLRTHNDMAVLVYQMSADFNGTFYGKGCRVTPTNHTGSLPYYIWIIGNTEQVVALRNDVPDDKFKAVGSGVQNVFSITKGNRPVKYAIQTNPNYKSDGIVITGLRQETRGQNRGTVKITLVNIDLSNFLLDEVYITDLKNWETNNDDFQIQNIRKRENNKYSLDIVSNRVRRGDVFARLLIEKPSWIETANDDAGVSPIGGKTFGIKYQINGVFDAFTKDNDHYTELKITIN